jgi:outer membrane protein OmpA-like peptidoglycan-associated protein
MTIRSLTLSLLTLSLVACGTVPELTPGLRSARDRVLAAQVDNQVASLAPQELQRAVDSLRQAERARLDGASVDEVEHLAYLSNQRVTIAQQTAWDRAAQAVTTGASAERDRLRLAQRSREVEQAQRATEAARLGTAQVQRALTEAQQAEARTAAQLASSGAAASQQQALMQGRLDRQDARVDELEGELQLLNARRTSRGTLVTLGDVLFDTGEARLVAEGGRSMASLAGFFRSHPQRSATIEGHTDNVGGAEVNQQLSQRRARAVLDALVGLGVGPDRLVAQGRGEDAPTASNATPAGRQLNRRVEILISPAPGR